MDGFQWTKNSLEKQQKKMQVYELLATCRLNNEQKQMFLRIM